MLIFLDKNFNSKRFKENCLFLEFRYIRQNGQKSIRFPQNVDIFKKIPLLDMLIFAQKTKMGEKWANGKWAKNDFFKVISN